MSLRVLLTKKENINEYDYCYNCIYSEESNWEYLLYEWFAYSGGVYLSPWKITIRDPELMDGFTADFRELKKYSIRELLFFDDVWAIYEGK